MTNAHITKDDENYVVMDTTVGEYLNRVDGNRSQTWTTCWSKELELISLKLDRSDLTDVLLAQKKNHYDYNKAVRAKNRHLKALKENLGLVSPKKEEKVKVFYRSSVGYGEMNSIREEEAIVYDKTIQIDNIKYKKQAIDYTMQTEEKAALVAEYNQKLAEFKEFQKAMLEKIFNDN